MEIRKLDHAALLVKDIERSRRFCGQVLGMEEVPRPRNFAFPGAWFRKGSFATPITILWNYSSGKRRNVIYEITIEITHLRRRPS